MLKLLSVLLVSVFTLNGAVVAAETEKESSINDLDLLLGKWRFADEATDLAGFVYREEGVMECSRALDDRYIACQSEGETNDKKRHYVTYYTYNSLSDEFLVTALFGNYPEKAEFVLTMDEDGRGFSMFSDPMRIPDGRTSTNWGKVTFENDDRFRWEVRLNRSGESPDHWPLKFLSTYERID